MYDLTWPPELTAAFLRAQELENVTVGQRANEKGHLAERRCLQSVNELCVRYPWIYGARLANLKEDSRGIDVVVETDLGKLYLQVKSSHYGAHKYRRKRPHAKTIIIIIPSDMTDAKLQNAVVDRLNCLRKHIKKLRQTT
jgi:hypothetical protein